MDNKKYIPVIGLEVHVELKTKSKMFCGCSADYFGQKPNTHTCPVCLGLPGALPVPNKKAIEWCVMIGIALNCETPLFSKFDRKNYFYPDLAKGYQISQYDEPFSINGSIEIASHMSSGKAKKIRIRRVHMEEDTGKLLHENINGEKVSLIDFNRSGVPLVEIVTEPDFDNAADVKEYLQKLQQIVRYLGVADADMEKGNMRLEPNISLRPLSHPELVSGSTEMPKQVRHDKWELPKYKVEVKNINSFRFVEKTIEYEIKRQAAILDEGKLPAQETRGWDEKKQITYSQRVKEDAHEYRYFPEPDIPPIRWTESQISNIKLQMPELPDKKFNRFIKEYGLTKYDTEILTRERSLADYFEEAVKVSKSVILGSKVTPGSDSGQASMTSKKIANHIINKKIDIQQTLPAQLIETILQSTQTTTIDEEKLEKIITEVLAENTKAVLDFKNGKETVIMYLVGQAMKKAKQKLDANRIKDMFIKKLKENQWKM